MIKHTTVESAPLSFARMKNIIEYGKKYPEYIDFVKDCISLTASFSDNCKFGMLWNALTEKQDKTLLKENFPDMMIQADSGGLQMITLGMDSSESTKQGIYERQSKYSTHAMSFDKMPVLVKEEEKNKDISMSLNHSAKYFVRELRFESGLESGMNLINQCKVFRKNKTDAKVLVIIQGSEFEDYQEYARGLFSAFDTLSEEETNELQEYIGGISMGMSGITNYFDLVDLYCRAPVDLKAIPEKLRHLVHFLGVGGPTKVAPLYAIHENFFEDYQKNVHYTFDSTSRTSSSTYGKFTEVIKSKNKTTIKAFQLGRNYSATVEKHLSKLFRIYGDTINKHLDDKVLVPDDFRQFYSPFSNDKLRLIKELQAEYGEKEGKRKYMNRVMVHDFLHWLAELYNFFIVLDNYKMGDYSSVSCPKLRQSLNKLHKIESYKEYMTQRDYFKLQLQDKTLGNMNIVETMDEFNKADATLSDEW